VRLQVADRAPKDLGKFANRASDSALSFLLSQPVHFVILAIYRAVRDHRSETKVPIWAVTASLFLGAFLRRPSFLQLEADTRRRGGSG
jgi:hypothetical protein